MLAEALNQIEIAELQMSKAAERLECSTSQLIKLIKLEDSAWQSLNQKRRDAGHGPLK